MQDLGLIDYAVKQRRFFIMGDVTDVLMQNACETLLMARKASKQKPFTIYLNTAGGSVTDAFAFCDLLRSMPYEVECICMGEVASAGLYVVAACDSRRALPNTYFLWHGMYWSPEGKTPKEMHQDSSHFVDFSQHAGRLLQEWTENPKIMKDLGPRLWFDVAKAQELGILNG